MPTRTTTLRAVRRAIEDEELQEHLRNAFVAARKLNSSLASQRGDAPRIAGLATDKKAQSELKVLVEELGATANRIAAAPKPRRGRRLRRAVLLIGAAVAAYMLIRRYMRGDTLRAETTPAPAPPVAPA